MSDHLTRQFRAQLTTAMDSIMRRTMFEVMKIFENSLSEFKMELVHKGEEIAHLKVKLQRAEIKLNEINCSDNKVEERNTSQKTQLDQDPDRTPQDPDRTPHDPEQSSLVPEFDFEVPDDWCAPLGSEIVSNKDNECPSVRLRKLYIPLCHVPVVKQEVDRHHIETRQHGNRDRRRRSGKKLKDLRHTLNQRPFKSKQQRRLKLERRVQDNLRESAEPTRSARKELKQMVNRKKRTEKVYPCSVCHKDFDSLVGLHIHERYHKCCIGCQKILPSKDVYNSHKLTCLEYKMMNRRGRPRKRIEAVSSSCKLKVSDKKHVIKCSFCPKTFQLNKALKVHVTKMHQKKHKHKNTNEDSSWTVPLELADTLFV